jgi:hypothetical protein
MILINSVNKSIPKPKLKAGSRRISKPGTLPIIVGCYHRLARAIAGGKKGKSKYNQLTGRITTSLCSSDGITHPELMDGGRPFLQEYKNSAPELRRIA